MEDLAREAIRAQGARVTATRVHVLATLMEAASALSHQELFDRIGSSVSVDRVTVYRVLEWLVQTGLAHRIAGEHHGEPHGHFQCDVCRRMFCIDAPVGIQQNLDRLPDGFEGRDVEMVVRGRCPACVQAGREAGDERKTH
ncbi:MAG: hypothetical protein ABT00_23285 [Bordetella sp. SCN 68-11]|nr:MAG: hypothetical protein ABT00_23285 [Bordetella sp. SCN 68-11]